MVSLAAWRLTVSCGLMVLAISALAADELFIEAKLAENEWNISRTAEAIGIQRSHLYNKMGKYDIQRVED